MILLAQTSEGTLLDFGITFVKVAVVIALLLGGFAYMTWFERRVLARMQWRLGPNRTGPFGLLQPMADGLKLLFKEQLTPSDARTFLFLVAPCISLTVALSVFAVVPFGGPDPWTIFGVTITPWIADVDVGLVFVLGVASISVYGIVLAGWSSGNHYSLLGAIRSSAQVISYELAMGMALLSPIMLSAMFLEDGTGTLTLRELVRAQETGGWFAIYLPIAFILFWVAGIAETNRAPFDLPEAEQELIAGYHTEYSGMRFAMFFMAEYVAMITMSAVGATAFLGGAGSPFRLLWTIWGGTPPENLLTWANPLWFVLKIVGFMFVFVWLRATFPRFRYDQLMRIGWQVMLPLGILNITVTSVFVALSNPMGWSANLVKWAVCAAMVLAVALLAMVGAARRRSGATARAQVVGAAP